MNKELWAYSIKIIGDNFFCGTFIDTKTDNIEVCYVLDGENNNTKILRKLISECMLIGYGNITYDDIILNYMWHNKTVETKELSSLSEYIINQTHLQDIYFYRNRYVDSIDLMKILGHNHYKIKINNKNVIKDNIDSILLTNLYDVRSILEMLNNLKEDLNYGFKSSYNKKPTPEDIHNNYLIKLIDL